jgi:uncharacterized RDD family membrane protein YckC
LKGWEYGIMRELIEIKTPENVTIEYELAGIGSRSLAVIIDTLIRYLVYIVLAIPLFFMSSYQIESLFRGWKLAILILIFFLMNWGYFIFFEMIMQGKTPGKKLMKLRALKENGRPINFLDSFIRNLFRVIIDNNIGIIIMFFNKRYKRIGDIVAGTIVIKERSLGKMVTLESLTNIRTNAETDNTPKADIDNNQEIRLTTKEYEVLKNFLERRSKMDKKARWQMASKLYDYFYKKSGIQKENWRNPEDFLEYLAKIKYTADQN